MCNLNSHTKGPKAIRTIMALIVVTAIAGCGHDVYRRANTTDTQYIQDENSCMSYAEAQPPAVTGPAPGAYQSNIEKQRNDIRSCMVARGYTLDPKWPFGSYGTSPTIGPNPAETPLGLRR